MHLRRLSLDTFELRGRCKGPSCHCSWKTNTHTHTLALFLSVGSGIGHMLLVIIWLTWPMQRSVFPKDNSLQRKTKLNETGALTSAATDPETQMCVLTLLSAQMFSV